jgi:hypothetical protein
MIVNDDTVSKALAYLADDPHPLAVAKFNLTTAENKTRETYAGLFLETIGTVKERESQVEKHPDLSRCREAEAECVFEYERHRSRQKAADMICEIWRSDNANARAAEKIR